MSIAAVAALAALGAAPAMAATISMSQTQIMTSDGQDFTFDFSGLASSDGTGGTITIASGVSTERSSSAFNGLDLDGSSEYFELTFDGISQGTYNCGGQDPHTEIVGNTGGPDCEFELVLTISGPDFDVLLADALISIGVLFSDTVGHFYEGDEVIVSLSYSTSGSAAAGSPATIHSRHCRYWRRIAPTQE